MPETNSHGIRISYDDLGRGGPVLLFMPGWCGGRGVFDPLVARCAPCRTPRSACGRGISAAYARAGSPLRSLAGLEPAAPPVLHLYAQPEDPGYLAAQQSFAADHDWFHVSKLDARSHFPMYEVPDEMAEAIERFVERRRVAPEALAPALAPAGAGRGLAVGPVEGALYFDVAAVGAVAAGTGKPRLRISAAMPASRPRKAR